MSTHQQKTLKTRYATLYVGNMGSGKSTSVRTLVYNACQNAFIYDTDGDDTFAGEINGKSIIPICQSLDQHIEFSTHFSKYREYPVSQELIELSHKFNFAPSLTLFDADERYITGFMGDVYANGLELWVMQPNKDSIIFGGYELSLGERPPITESKARLELCKVFIPAELIAATQRNFKARVMDTSVAFQSESPKDRTIARHIPTLRDSLFVVSDGSTHLHKERVYNRSTHEAVTKCRHKGVDIIYLVHRLNDLHPEHFGLCNQMYLRKQNIPPEVPKHLKSVTDDVKIQQLNKPLAESMGLEINTLYDAIEYVEHHANPFECLPIVLREKLADKQVNSLIRKK